MVLPGVYVLTVPVSYVVVSVVVAVVGAVVVVCSVVVALVCANATGAISAQATVMMLLFIIPSLVFVFGFCLDPNSQGTASLAEIGRLLLDQAGRVSIRSKLDLFRRRLAEALYL